MSAGGVFTLIANEGRTDRLLLATALLQQRIHDIQCARRRAGKMDCWPTLVDIERTHVLFMNAHYKPFVAIGYEYNKVKVQNGVPSFGTQVVFSVPQFGDFFYDIVCRVTFGSWGTAADSTPEQNGVGVDQFDSQGNKVTLASGQVYNPSFQASSFPQGDVNDVASTGFANYYRLVRYDGRTLVDGGVGASSKVEAGFSDVTQSAARAFVNLVRWVEYPANRLFKKVWFNVNNNPLDEYNDVASVMYQKFCVPVNKEVGYNRMTGQEVPHDAWSGVKNVNVLQSDNGATAAQNWVTNVKTATGLGSAILSTQQGDAVDENGQNWGAGDVDALQHLPVGDPIIARYLQKVVDGPQTPKEVQPALEIMHRLRFWFNEDVRLAVPSVSIPYGQRFIHMELAPVEDMALQEPGLFVEHIKTSCGLLPVGDASTSESYAFGPTVASASAKSVARSESSFYPYLQNLTNDTLLITNMELYINNIFVNPEIHDIYIRRIGFTLIRVHRIANISVNEEGQGEKLISQLKWPIEYLFVGMRPRWNTSHNNRWMWRDWHRMTKVDTGIFPDAGHSLDMFSAYDYDPTKNLANGDTPTTATFQGKHVLHLQKLEVQKSTFAVETNTVDTLNVTAHGITLYDYFSNMFYNNYIPYQYGGYNIKTPADPGALMITFCLFPKTYQPSGHLNVSRAREFYIGWTTSYVNAARTAELLVVASAINFLLISDGSAVLRYST